MALWLRQVDERGNEHLYPFREGMEIPDGWSLHDDTPPPPAPVCEQPVEAHPVAEFVQYPDTVRESPGDDTVIAGDDVSVQLIRPKNLTVKGW